MRSDPAAGDCAYEQALFRRQSGRVRDHIDQEFVDLVYLDPPFNSQENYNVLFKERSGAGVGAQVEAFRDTWKWEDGAANAYEDVMRFNGDAA